MPQILGWGPQLIEIKLPADLGVGSCVAVDGGVDYQHVSVAGAGCRVYWPGAAATLTPAENIESCSSSIVPKTGGIECHTNAFRALTYCFAHPGLCE